MPSKKKLEISKRSFTLFIGILLCLFSIMLILNVGYVARAISFPFLYVFGFGAYLLYLLFFINGFCLIFLDHPLLFRRKIRIPGLLFAFLGIIILITIIATKNDPLLVLGSGGSNQRNFFNAFNDVVFKNINGGYFKEGFLDVFSSNHFGGGIFGYLLTALLNQLGQVTGYIVSITLIVIGVLLILLPTVLLIVKTQMEKQGLPVKEDEELKGSKKPSPKKKPRRNNKNDDNRITNIDIISSASELDEEDNHSNTSSSVFISSDSPNNYDNPSYYQSNGTFIPARFITSMDIPDNSHPEPSEPVKEAPVAPALNEEKNNPYAPHIDETPIIKDEIFEETPVNPAPSKVEQMNLFESEAEPDTSLAATQQTYSEPVAIPKDPLSIIPDASPRLKFVPPSLELLNDYEQDESKMEENIKVAEQRVIVINKTFEHFKVGARCIGYTIGPSVTRFNIEYDYNVSITAVKRIIPDVAMRLGGLTSARFEQIVAGETFSGLEVPNPHTITVSFKGILQELPDASKNPSAVGFGKNISGKTIYSDFVGFPHMLLAGTTGSGKSIFIHSLIMTFIMRNSPDDLKLVLIDPKQVEMNMYEGLPHLLTPIITNGEKAKVVMNKLCDEMERRNSLFKPVRVTNIKAYNKWAEDNNKQKLPYIFVIFDEYADCHDVCKDIELPIRRLCQKARSAGIHVLLATQRPSTDVVTGTLKGNLPTHVALLTASAVDSTVILGEGGAESLLGRGDMLIQVPGFSRGGSIRVQSPFVSDDEINAVVSYLVNNYPCNYDPSYDTPDEEAASIAEQISSPVQSSSMEGGDDELYNSVKEWAMSQDYVSMSRIQREFSTGFNRAGRLFKRLQQEGIVASKPDTASSAKGCRVLVKENKFMGDDDSDSEDDMEEEINTGE